MTVDARVDVQGVVGSPDSQIGQGNIANLIGDTKISYPASGCNLDVDHERLHADARQRRRQRLLLHGQHFGQRERGILHGAVVHGIQGRPAACWEARKPNTTTGKFFVKKGRVQLEKPKGVDAISGDVIVGGQGFNDCLFWKQSDQLKDSVNITLLDAGNNGAAYLDLNGCSETAASLTMTVHNKIKTDAPGGGSGTLTVKSLTIGGVKKPAGVYTAAADTWIEGKGKVIVRP